MRDTAKDLAATVYLVEHVCGHYVDRKRRTRRPKLDVSQFAFPVHFEHDTLECDEFPRLAYQQQRRYSL